MNGRRLFVACLVLSCLSVVSCAPMPGDSAPVVAGDPVVGGRLTASSGAWVFDPGAYEFSWMSCEAGEPSNCRDVGDDSPTLVLTVNDLGRLIRVRVKASNAVGWNLQVSAPVGPVRAAPDLQVANLQVANRFSKAFWLTWTNPPLGGESTIVVRRAVGHQPPQTPNDGVDVALPEPGAERTADLGLEPGTQYAYSVFVVTAGQASPPQSVTGSTTEAPAPPGEIPASTRILADGDVVSATPGAAEATVKVVIRDGVAAPPPGGSVIIPVSEEFPDGMLAEVAETTTNADGTTTVLVRPGALAEALPDTIIEQDQDLNFESAALAAEGSTGRAQGSMARVTADNGVAALALPAQALDCQRTTGEDADPGDLFESGNPLPISVTFSAWHWSQYFDPGSIFPSRAPALTIQLSGQADISASLNAVSGGFSCELTAQWRREHRLSVRIGTVPGTPLPVTFNLEPGLKFEVDASAGVTFTQHRYWAYTIYKYDDNPLIARRAGSADPATASASGKVTISAEAFADLSVMTGGGFRTANAQAGLYGTIGPFIDLTVEASTADANVCISVEGGLKSTFGLRLELWAKRWNLELADVTWVKANLFQQCVPPRPYTDISPVSSAAEATQMLPLPDGSHAVALFDPTVDRSWLVRLRPNDALGSGFSFSGQIADLTAGPDSTVYALTPEAGGGNAIRAISPDGTTRVLRRYNDRVPASCSVTPARRIEYVNDSLYVVAFGEPEHLCDNRVDRVNLNGDLIESDPDSPLWRIRSSALEGSPAGFMALMRNWCSTCAEIALINSVTNSEPPFSFSLGDGPDKFTITDPFKDGSWFVHAGVANNECGTFFRAGPKGLLWTHAAAWDDQSTCYVKDVAALGDGRAVAVVSASTGLQLVEFDEAGNRSLLELLPYSEGYRDRPLLAADDSGGFVLVVGRSKDCSVDSWTVSCVELVVNVYNPDGTLKSGSRIGGSFGASYYDPMLISVADGSVAVASGITTCESASGVGSPECWREPLSPSLVVSALPSTRVAWHDPA